MPQDHIGSGFKRGICHGLLVIGDQPRHKMNAPVQRQHDLVGGLLGGSHVGEKRREILLVRRGDDPRRHARLIVNRLVADVRANGATPGLSGRRHTLRAGSSNRPETRCAVPCIR